MFQLKFKKLFRDFIERHMLKQIKIHFYVIEFQKRNFFHVYIFIINYFINDVILINVNNVVSIEISEKIVVNFSEHVKRLYDIVIINIIHKNCTIETQYKNSKNEYIKRFSKLLQLESNFNYLLSYLFYLHRERINILKTL